MSRDRMSIAADAFERNKGHMFEAFGVPLEMKEDAILGRALSKFTEDESQPKIILPQGMR